MARPNADAANGRRLEEGVLAKTPWGELAYALAGREGFERVRCGSQSIPIGDYKANLTRAGNPVNFIVR